MVKNLKIPERPLIYELNTATFLNQLSVKYNAEITLGRVPDSEWDHIKNLGFDTVWFMGVWKRSPTAKSMAKDNTELKTALTDLTDQDLLGSAYSINDYTVDDTFGGNEGLAIAREQLNNRGVSLILDFVPNHVALDHPWTNHSTDYFVVGNEEDIANQPNDFYRIPTGIIAKGKDPNFPPWSDVAQLNAFSEAYRNGAIKILTNISKQCDGVRCDMAMLMLNEIFAWTWGEKAGQPPATDFWEEVIPAVRSNSPDFTFIAEAYWDLQNALFNQGFDICYDKDFYDLLYNKSAKSLREHLLGTSVDQVKLLRFIENHDEVRVAKYLSVHEARAAAVMLVTQDSARLIHQGQIEGFKIRVPVHLGRGPAEIINDSNVKFYEELLGVLRTMNLKIGHWQHKACTFGRLDRESKNILGWQWSTSTGNYVVAINYSSKKAGGRIIPSGDKPQTFRLMLGSTGIKIDYSRKQNSLNLNMKPWGYAIIEL